MRVGVSIFDLTCSLLFSMSVEEEKGQRGTGYPKESEAHNNNTIESIVCGYFLI